ncbi:putative glycosyl transferase [Cedecea davisae]|uniref:Glycosyltransferase, group 2 family protein n=1 Tax=Cedecea davisae DSM 4568 TaxID=566551 RepID=S3ITY3_9ENTR|nr:glycosyltransferase family 2 protein [Cedecea davisae]EPF16011.1 glycosyltransferase, group 2 family protein [Cedecea davisae DSM 4568]SUX38681.1 putative glycosyl transferase [Cedecea davisae]
MSSAKIGIVTVFYNSPEVLPDFYQSLSIQEHSNYHLYVVDNSSNDQSFKLAQQLSAQYKITSTMINNHGENVGVAAGNNQGIHAALADQCEYILIANNDLLFDDATILSNIISIAENEKEEILSPAILNYPEKKAWYVGGYFDCKRALAPHEHVGADYNDIKDSLPKHCTYSPTCFLMVHKSVFDKIGKMDEKYFAYYDDTDFMYRAMLASYKVRIVSDSIIYHKVSISTGGGYSAFGAYHLTRNRIYFAKKCLTFPVREISIVYTICTRLMLPAIRKESRGVYKNILKGIRDGLRM